MADSVKYVLHYGGEQFELQDGDLLTDYEGDAGTIGFRLANDDWMTITVGPGIPIAVQRVTVRASRSVPARMR